MRNHLRAFAAAREVVLPCLYLPPGTKPPTDTGLRTGDATAEAKRQARVKLRVSPFTLPGVERAVAKACRFLRVPRNTVHAFVSPEIGRNAQCLMGADEPVIVFGSALVELMTEDELACVAGHEIGHFLLPECAMLSDEDSQEGRRYSRAAEITMDRIGLIACNDLQAACRAEMKLMCGLKDPHLRPDVSAFLNEAREAFDGTFRREEDNTHPPAQLRLRAIVEFASSDACLRAWGLDGGTPVAQVNQSVTRLLHEQIDRHTLAEMTEPVLMAKAWLYCLCRSHGHEPDLMMLNQVGPAVEAERLQKAWASLRGFNDAQLREHAHKRMAKAAENAFQRSPQMMRTFFEFIAEHPYFTPLHHLLKNQ
jgi:hypothetical protein